MKVTINGHEYHKPTDKQRNKLKKQGFAYGVSLDGIAWHGAHYFDIAKTYKHSWSL